MRKERKISEFVLSSEFLSINTNLIFIIWKPFPKQEKTNQFFS